MERGLFRIVQGALRASRRRRRAGQRFSDADIVPIALWAALHDRPIDWACRRSSWPSARRPRRLPDQSTMSRRLRAPAVTDLLRLVLMTLALAAPPCTLAVLDGRALEVSRHTRDRHARRGWGRGGFANGYRLHALIDAASGRVPAHVGAPMRVAECVVARLLLTRARRAGLLAPDARVLADASYDSNPLHRHAASLDCA